MAVQSPPIPPKQTIAKNASPLKISPTPTKPASTMASKPVVPSTPTNSSTPTAPTTPTTPSSMPNQPEPKKRKWLWILLGIFGVIIVLAVGVGLYLGLRP